jgi:hypothetical protein
MRKPTSGWQTKDVIVLRPGRIYFDYARNGLGATAVGCYSAEQRLAPRRNACYLDRYRARLVAANSFTPAAISINDARASMAVWPWIDCSSR